MRYLWRASIMAFFLLAACQTAKRGELTEHTESEKAAVAYAHLGLAYLEQGQGARAKQKLLHAQERAPHLALVHYSLGYYYAHIGEQAQAEKAYRKAVSVAPTDGEAHHYLATFLCHSQRYTEAEKHFLKALSDRHVQNSAEILENAGLCQRASGHIDKAEEYFLRAYRQDPYCQQALLELAEIAAEKGECSQAQNWIQHYENKHTLSPAAEARMQDIAHRCSKTAGVD